MLGSRLKLSERRSPMIRPAAKAALIALALSTTALSPLASRRSSRRRRPRPRRDAVPPIAYKQRTLANGLKVFTSLDRDHAQRVGAGLVRRGLQGRPAGPLGLRAPVRTPDVQVDARTCPPSSFDRLTEDVGGFNNASTADDFTDYYEVVPANHLRAPAAGPRPSGWARWWSTRRCSSPSATW